jgi:nitroimidazol reductase NimA-like FMN-containing flavoprotein (pyridoxamine 5'-phosphate oxidase superfamily)
VYNANRGENDVNRTTGRVATLSKPRLDEFLQGSSIIATLATLDRRQRPYLVPVWYEWDGSAIWIISKPRAEYVKNLKRNAHGAVSIATSRLPYVRVFIQGRAQLIETDKDWLSMGFRMAERYLGKKEGRAYIDKTKNWRRLYIKLRPTRILSWDGGVSGHVWGKKYIQTTPGARPGVDLRAISTPNARSRPDRSSASG